MKIISKELRDKINNGAKLKDYVFLVIQQTQRVRRTYWINTKLARDLLCLYNEPDLFFFLILIH